MSPDDRERDTMPPEPPLSSPNHAAEFAAIVGHLLDDAVKVLRIDNERLRLELRTLYDERMERLERIARDHERRITDLEQAPTEPPLTAE